MTRCAFASIRLAVMVCVAALGARSAAAQQRPLATEDPEAIGAGRILVEGGIDYSHDIQYPVSGLTGNLWRIPILGVSFGISSIAELQIDGGFFDHLSITKTDPAAPLAHLLTVTGTSTNDVDDLVIGTKIRLVGEGERRPSFGVRFATRLPNATNESGLGLDTTDFTATLLVAKTVQSVRVVGNMGVGILANPTEGGGQNDVLLYGLSVARAMTQKAELVGELNGRASIRSGDAFPGTESRGVLKLGARYTQGSIRFDAGLFFGLHSVDPSVGFTTGFTYVFKAFTLP
jgi:hypothetical protein